MRWFSVMDRVQGYINGHSYVATHTRVVVGITDYVWIRGEYEVKDITRVTSYGMFCKPN